MDESWRMRMGMPATLPRRGSTEDPVKGPAPRRSMEALDPDDFADVFGGPPRSVLSRKFSEDFTRPSTTFYEEIFRQPEFVTTQKKSGGRSLPAFRIPARGGAFYSDVFGSADELRRSVERSRSNSKGKSESNSSSVLSSEELSPLRRTVAVDDVALSSFASKLRPINVPCRWNSIAMDPEERLRKHGMPSFHCSPHSHSNSYYMEREYKENLSSSCFRVSRQVSSPETTILEPNSYPSIKLSVDDFQLNSPSSPASSLCQEPEAKAGMQCDPTREEMEHEEDEVMSSYVIEINSDHRKGHGEAVSIDEAIAWAKQKFQEHSGFDRQSEKEHSVEEEEIPVAHEFIVQKTEGHERIQSSMDELKKRDAEKYREQPEKNMELEVLEQEVNLWAASKGTNIGLLLSTLHHILWPDSGWFAIPPTNLIDSSNVRKAYQKARLCLHPDKLQQRGATVQQKFIAEKAFSILQDAWTAFLSQDVN
ncbi:hypothetical protein K2173_006611 [Erythroxylum novogranatense]|uniref:Uncharacterized protein n=1 Tax=Erythroxylum novogranatense TaxID=1862640 RepID=A0AAV8T6T0_9ROSI|nr:hypothetical protein K2173_006611 [Erythroxylum novogranatense]